MKTNAAAPSYKGYRYPPEIISHAVWLCFLSAFGLISDHFRPKRHRLNASVYRALVQDRFQIWNEVTGGKIAA